MLHPDSPKREAALALLQVAGESDWSSRQLRAYDIGPLAGGMDPEVRKNIWTERVFSAVEACFFSSKVPKPATARWTGAA
eukprot:8045873-Pyramimonas_sp.AAC.1